MSEGIKIRAAEKWGQEADDDVIKARAESCMASLVEMKLRIEKLPSAQSEPCEDTVSREAVSEWLKQYGQDVLHGKYKFSLMYIWKNLMDLPSAQPERVWTPCDIPPEHHRDVIVRGIEAIGGNRVYKVMQWDNDTWRPKDYAPSIEWLDWSEI